MADVNQSNERLEKAVSKKAANQTMVNRASGIILLIFLFGILWVYGWGGEIRYASVTGNPTSGLKGFNIKTQTQTLFGSLYVIDTVFVVIGFGLLFTYFKKSTAVAFFTTIFVVSFTSLVSPIFSKFWYNIFLTDFEGSSIQTDNPSRFYHYSLGSLQIYLDYYNLRIGLANSISQLVVYLTLFGKVTSLQVVINTLLFNFIWNLNHFLCVYLNRISPDLRIFDDYQISNVYLFAATYGFIVSLFLKKPPIEETSQFSSNQHSSVLAHLGTFFLFLSFCTTTTMYSLKYTLNSENERSFIWQQAFISIFIAMSASIIFNYAFSVLFNPYAKLGIRGSLVGTISGAIMYGSVAGTAFNIGAAIAVGLAAGFVSAIFFEKIYPAYNKSQIRDSFGGLSILFISFLGTFLIAPTVIKTYFNYSVTLPTFYQSKTSTPGIAYSISKVEVAGWCLVNVGVSIGVALVGGFIIGAILLFFQRQSSKCYEDSQIFPYRYGLRQQRKAEGENAIPSAQNLMQGK